MLGLGLGLVLGLGLGLGLGLAQPVFHSCFMLPLPDKKHSPFPSSGYFLPLIVN